MRNLQSFSIIWMPEIDNLAHFWSFESHNLIIWYIFNYLNVLFDAFWRIFVEGRDLSDLRQELKTDVHMVEMEVLCERFNTDLVKGKSTSGKNSELSNKQIYNQVFKEKCNLRLALFFKPFRHRKFHHKTRTEQDNRDKENSRMAEILSTVSRRLFSSPLDRFHPMSDHSRCPDQVHRALKGRQPLPGYRPGRRRHHHRLVLLLSGA